VANMTVAELRKFITEVVDERLFGRFELRDTEAPDTRSWDQVKRDIEQHRWTPPPGAKSSLDLLREDRNR